jgi:hypothetical protein
MALRIVKSSIAIDAPFKLKGRDETLPAGSYDIETEDEIVEGTERTAYRRVATVLYIGSNGMRRAVTVDPKDLETARSKHPESSKIETPSPKPDSSKIGIANPSPNESYHLNREPHERMLAAETTDPQTRAAHLKLATMHGKMAREAGIKLIP